jgi:murein tripeptide amidase MpaA
MQSQRAGLKIRFFHNPMLNRVVDLLVAPESIDQLKQVLKSNQITFNIKTDNFQNDIDSEQDVRKENRITFKDSSSASSQFVTSRYMKLNEIESYLEGLARDYPNLVTIENIGTTYENRRMLVAKIGTKNTTKVKPAIWIDSGIHAREWIAPAVGLYILNKLITNSSARQYVENLNWYFLPVMNPDGYDYTHTTDRMWRKKSKEISHDAMYRFVFR